MIRTGLEEGQVWACPQSWHKGLILRSEQPIRETNRVLKGRAGIRRNPCSYHLYIRNPKENRGDKGIGNTCFVPYKQSTIRAPSRSKARMVLESLKEHAEKAFFSKEIADTLKEPGVNISDVMSKARRYERKGLAYVRGYRTHDRQTPFKEGNLLTWINSSLPREDAITEAMSRTDRALEGRAATSPTIEGVYRIRNTTFAATKTRQILAQSFIAHELGCSEHELETSIRRTLQLHPDLKELKLFNNYLYFYHASILQAKGRMSVRKDGKYFLYLPRNLVEDSAFPFGLESCTPVIVAIDRVGRRLLIMPPTEDKRVRRRMD